MGLRDVLNDQLKAIPSLIDKDTKEVNSQLLLTRAQTNDSELLHTLYQNEELRKVFFTDIVSEDTKIQITVFDNLAFRRYIELNDTPLGWTQHAKKVGLKINDVFLKARDKEWSLVWPYKDCVLEGGQSAEEHKRTEIFFNKLLAHDEVTKLLEEKVLSNHKIYTKGDNSTDYESMDTTELKGLLEERGEKVSRKKEDLVSRLLESDNAKFEPFNRDATINKERSLDHNTITDNLLIHGNNLMGMHTIKKQFRGKVKVIYFDPPYYFRITKPADTFSYNSNFKLSTWLTFMQDRLEIAKELLHEDGVIFVSIDDDGLAHLKLLMDMIFGEKRFIANFVWKRKKKGTFLNKTRVKMSEYILAYGNKDTDKIQLFGEEAYSDKAQPIVKKTNTVKELKFPAKTVTTKLKDGKYPKGIHNTKPDEKLQVRFMKEFTVRNGRITTQLKVKGRFTWLQDMLDDELKKGSRPDLSTQFGFNVYRHDEEGKFKAPSTLVGTFCYECIGGETNSGKNVGTNEDASKELADLLGKEVGEAFTFSKPSSLIRYLIQMVTHFDKNAIVLDAFAGSGTTGQAVMQLNKSDGGRRQFILLEQLDYVETLTAHRLMKSMEEYDLNESFRLIELKKWNESFIEGIKNATSKKKLSEIWEEIKSRGFMEYNFKMKAHEENSKEFANKPLNDQKVFYCELLDMNHLYVNLSSLDDQEFDCSEQEKALTKDFYKVDKNVTTPKKTVAASPEEKMELNNSTSQDEVDISVEFIEAGTLLPFLQKNNINARQECPVYFLHFQLGNSKAWTQMLDSNNIQQLWEKTNQEGNWCDSKLNFETWVNDTLIPGTLNDLRAKGDQIQSGFVLVDLAFFD